MKAKRLPTRKQRARLTQSIEQSLKAGIVGVITPNNKQLTIAGQEHVPDYIFRPDVNPELSFLVYVKEVELLAKERA